MAFIGNTNTTQAFTPAIDYFSGNASTTAFTLSRPVASVAQVQVVVNNVAQNPSSAYTVSSNTITFTSAPSSGTNNIYVYYTSPITQVIAPGQGTVTATSFVSSTGTGAGVFQTSPTITTPTISSLSSASATALTLQSAGTTAVTIDTSQNASFSGAITPAVTGVRALGSTSSKWSSVYTSEVADGTDQLIGSSGTTFRVGAGSSWTAQAFYTGGTERMRINSSGNLLIGNTDQNFKLSVLESTNANATAIRATNASFTGDCILIDAGPAASTSYSFISARANYNSAASLVFRVQGNGNVQNTNNSYGAISDVKLKENIVDATPKLADLLQVKVRNFNFVGDANKQIGVVAQELETVFPSMVEETPDKDDDNNDLGTTTKAVKYSVFVPMLIKAIQELKAINDTQAETINALTARIEALENR